MVTKRQSNFVPLGDSKRRVKTAEPTPSREERVKLIDEAMNAVGRQGGDSLLSEMVARRARLAQQARLEKQMQLPVADRARDLGGEDLLSCFQALRRHGVSREGQMRALNYLEPIFWRVQSRKKQARERGEASEIIPRLRKWLREGKALLARRFEAEGGLPPVVQDVMRQLHREISWDLVLLLPKYLPRLPRPRTGSVPTGIDSDQELESLYRLFKDNATLLDEPELQLRNLRKDAENVLRLLSLRRQRRRKSEVGIRTRS